MYKNYVRRNFGRNELSWNRLQRTTGDEFVCKIQIQNYFGNFQPCQTKYDFGDSSTSARPSKS